MKRIRLDRVDRAARMRAGKRNAEDRQHQTAQQRHQEPGSIAERLDPAQPVGSIELE
jgi:hypothetical protein